MAALPPEAENLLAVNASKFVTERGKLARELRDAGRSEEARAVSELRKPSAVVLAVNRAARDRPQAAQDAADAARRVGDALAGDMDAYRGATNDLQRALDLLVEVAVAHVASPGKPATESMRRRVQELLRNAVADDVGRAALERGVLTEERQPAGFSVLEGMPVRRKRDQGSQQRTAQSKARETHRGREQALREELARIEEELRAAERALKQAERKRARAEKAAAAARGKLERL